MGCMADELTIDPGKIVTDTNALPVNLTAEIARAKSENKLLLLEFGSSDACPPCILMEQKVFSTPDFQAFANSNLDFVRLDFPVKVNLRADTTATNLLLSQQFDVQGFPTFIALNNDGKIIWTQVGVDDSMFETGNFIRLVEAVKKKEK
jgi:thioredoxin-related protein